MDREQLKVKLDEIAALEKENHVVGVGFATTPTARVLTENAVDFVCSFLKYAVTMVQKERSGEALRPVAPDEDYLKN
jgi:hypothetical protein